VRSQHSESSAKRNWTKQRQFNALTETEAARYIGMSAAWLKKSRTRRFRSIVDAPPFVRAGSKRVLCRREDLDAWQERRLQGVGPSIETLSDDRSERVLEDADAITESPPSLCEAYAQSLIPGEPGIARLHGRDLNRGRRRVPHGSS